MASQPLPANIQVSFTSKTAQQDYSMSTAPIRILRTWDVTSCWDWHWRWHRYWIATKRDL